MAAKSTKKEKITPEALAEIALKPSTNAAAIIEQYGKPYGDVELPALVTELSASIEKVQAGDMSRCEGMLIAQAEALQTMFMNLARRAANQEYINNYEAFVRMALKAQSQCRMTLETLSAIKNPPVVYAKQANISHGPQQVNNGPSPAHAESIVSPSNELLGEIHTERLEGEAMNATSATVLARQ